MKLLVLLIAGVLAPLTAHAEEISGRVIGLDIIRKAIYVSHEASGETRGDNKFLWDDQVPGREYLEASGIGDEIVLEAVREEAYWRVTKVPAAPGREAMDPLYSSAVPGIAMSSAAVSDTTAATTPPIVITASPAKSTAPAVAAKSVAAPPAPIAAKPRAPLPQPPPMSFKNEMRPLAPASPTVRSQFQIEETRVAPAALPPPSLRATLPEQPVKPRSNIQPSNERPAPVTRRALSDLPGEDSGSQDRPGRNPILGLLSDSINGAARSVDGAFDRMRNNS